MHRKEGAPPREDRSPGYIIIKPDFPECIDNFGFLWFEDEYTISDASTWVLAANAANALAK